MCVYVWLAQESQLSPCEAAATIVTSASAAAKLSLSRMAVGTSLLWDTLSSHPSGTRARLLHPGPHRWNIATEPTSTWRDKNPCLLRQVGSSDSGRDSTENCACAGACSCCPASGQRSPNWARPKRGSGNACQWHAPGQGRHPSAAQKVLPKSHGLLMAN